MEGGIRIDDTPVHKALREALVNCLINTDYYGRCGIVIKVNLDSIVIENPGDIRLGKKQMMRGGISDPRNKTLMKMFNMINIGERAGSGVPDIYAVWEKEGWKVPIIEEQYNPDRTILMLSFEKGKDEKSATKIGDKKISEKKKIQFAMILDVMQIGEEYKNADIAAIVDLKSSRTRDLLNELVAMEKIETIGDNKNRRYRLK